MKADKPFKTYPEQVVKLADHDIVVPKGSEEYVIAAFKQYGYYNLVNAYQDKLSHTEDEKFDPPLPFGLFVTIKQIDEILSGILLPLVIHLENTFETSLSYHIAEKFGVFHKNHDDELGYLNRKRYPKRNMDPGPTIKKLQEFATGIHVGKFDKDKQQHNTEPSRFKVSASLNMYRIKHNHVPPWILVNDISFGLAARWYAISPPNIKRLVLNDLLPETDISEQEALALLRKALDIAQDYRNTIAHGTSILKTRLSYPSSDSKLPPSIIQAFHNPKILSEHDYTDGYGQSDVYALLLILALFTKGHISFQNAIKDIQRLLEPQTDGIEPIKQIVMFDVLGFPTDAYQRLEALSEFYDNRS